MKVTDETKAMAQNIVDYIVQYPERHQQFSWWGMQGDTEEDQLYPSADVNICDTTMCIAGTTVYLDQGKEGMRYHAKNGGWTEAAAPLLGLDEYEASELFHIMDNGEALDGLIAIASGDEDKFRAILDQSDSF